MSCLFIIIKKSKLELDGVGRGYENFPFFPILAVHNLDLFNILNEENDK